MQVRIIILFKVLVPQAPKKEEDNMIIKDLSNSFNPVPKIKRIKNQKLINDKKHNCEYCGKKNCYTNKHHIKTKGASGDDTEDNLIELCGACHRKVHDGAIERNKLIQIINNRGKTN